MDLQRSTLAVPSGPDGLGGVHSIYIGGSATTFRLTTARCRRATNCWLQSILGPFEGSISWRLHSFGLVVLKERLNWDGNVAPTVTRLTFEHSSPRTQPLNWNITSDLKGMFLMMLLALNLE